MDRLKIIDGIRDLGLSVLPTGAKLVLFGSQARNDARSDSDWDLLILIDGQKVSKADFENYAYPFIEWGWDGWRLQYMQEHLRLGAKKQMHYFVISRY